MTDDQLIQELATKFDLQLITPVGSTYSFAADDLVKEENMRKFIDCYRPLMKALDDTAVAAYFGSWFSSVALALQYSLSIADSIPDLSLSNLDLHLVPSNGYCRVAYVIKQWKSESGPLDGLEREKWRQRVLSDFYQNTARPIIQSISTVSGLASGQIWGQLPTKFNYYMDIWTESINDDDTLQKLQNDYECLKNDISSDVFGLLKNPFQVKIRNIESLADPKKNVQMRNRCCLYYLTEGGDYCYTCPRLKEEEMAERRMKHKEQATLS